MQAETTTFMASVASRGVTLVEPYVTILNTAYYNSKQTANGISKRDYWLNFVWIGSEYTEAQRKVIVLTDMIDPSRVATLHNDYAGSHVVGVGFVGNNTDFGILTDFIPGTATNYTQNTGVYGLLDMSDTGKTGSWIVSNRNVANTRYCMVMPSHYTEDFMLVNNGAALNTDTFRIPRAYNHQYKWAQRASSTVTNEYNFGMKTALDTEVSATLPTDKTGLLGICIGGVFGVGAANFTPCKIGFFGAGGGGVDMNQWEEENNTMVAHVGSSAYFNKLVLSMGDSIFGPQSQGLFSQMYQTAFTTLNDHWGLMNLSASGKWIQDFDTQYASRIAGHYRSYYNPVVHVYASSNDLASGETAANVYTRLKSVCNKLVADGYTRIFISGVIDRTAGLLISQAAFNAARAALSALILADFPTAHGTIANYYLPTTFVYATGYFDPYGDAILNDSTNATYFPDAIHLTATGNDYFATDVLVPILQDIT